MKTKFYSVFYILLAYLLCMEFLICTVISSPVQFQHGLVRRSGDYDSLVSELKSKGSRMR